METVTIPKKKYTELKQDAAFFQALSKLDEDVSKSIFKSLKEVSERKLERVF